MWNRQLSIYTMNSKFVNIASGTITMSIMAAAITIGMLGQPQVDSEQQHCMAMNIYHESRSEVIEGQIAVAHVTANRVNHENWPNNICDVVYQNKQFSWTFLVQDKTPTNKKLWDQSLVIARDVMIGNTVDPTNGAVFYHANYVNPTWASKKQLSVSKVIGVHIFYTWTGTWD